jgi:hypothetical protein
MINKANNENLSLEELKAKRQKMKSTLIGLSIPMTIALIALIYLSTKNNNTALLAVGICSYITLIPSYMALKKVDEEILGREK